MNDDPPKSMEEQIADMLRESEASGELRRAASWGRPMNLLTDEYMRTPPELRMPFKILKDANCPPPEVQMLRELARLREALAAESDRERAAALAQRINEMTAVVSLRLERLKTGSL